jgi:hypothetical protein
VTTENETEYEDYFNLTDGTVKAIFWKGFTQEHGASSSLPSGSVVARPHGIFNPYESPKASSMTGSASSGLIAGKQEATRIPTWVGLGQV